eukprot:TRINITY_DN27839_c0_g1_i1.p1 TRINITY_DN27839_c0_g1~~TRINITY_DN27839_c0_g1_i1.p1  ORF type:complete len:212 (+),score=43.19 TRINITY_DN27839_c0_g1_i1:71-637(+)
MHHLVLSLLGNIVASVTMMCMADGCAQIVEKEVKEDEEEEYDWARTARMGVLGVFSVHYLSAWYHVLDWAYPSTGLKTVTMKAIVDNIESIPYYFIVLCINTALATGSFASAPAVASKEIGPLTLVSLLIWIPEDILMFTFIPMEYWIVVDKLVDLIYLPIVSYLANRSLKRKKPLVVLEEEVVGKKQ